MTIALVAFGANLGDPAESFAFAAGQLSSTPGIESLRLSRLYRTDPVGGPAESTPYLNGAFAFETHLSATEILARLQEVQKLGGRRSSGRWEPREIDLDLVWMEETVLDTGDLVVPHPRMHFRWFVLRPAADLEPTARHPILGWSMAELLSQVESEPSFLLVTDRSADADVCAKILRERHPSASVARCPISGRPLRFLGTGGNVCGIEPNEDSIGARSWALVVGEVERTETEPTGPSLPALDARGRNAAEIARQVGYFLDSLHVGTPVG